MGGTKTKAVIIAVGDEVLCGDVVNTNAAYLSGELDALGIRTMYHVCIPDEASDITEEFNKAYHAADIIFLTGGLGPTKDDLTKETVGEALGLEPVADKASEEHIHKYFSKIGRQESANNNKQYYIPNGSEAIPNNNGTAPGIYLETSDNKIIAMFPGPPNELIPMYESFVAKKLKARTQRAYAEKYYMLSGVGEAQMEDMLRRRIPTTSNYTLNTYITQSGIRLRAVASASDISEAEKMIAKHDGAIKQLLEKWIYSEKKEEIWESVAQELISHKLSISAAESCTGGLFASLLTKTAGISDIFSGSMVTYSDKIKAEMLGVKQETLNKYGAVSEKTAAEMAANIREKFSSDIGVAITGLAGPSQGAEKEPVGCVFICINFKGISEVARNLYIGSRTSVQMRSAVSAFKMIDEMLKKY